MSCWRRAGVPSRPGRYPAGGADFQFHIECAGAAISQRGGAEELGAVADRGPGLHLHESFQGRVLGIFESDVVARVEEITDAYLHTLTHSHLRVAGLRQEVEARPPNGDAAVGHKRD